MCAALSYSNAVFYFFVTKTSYTGSRDVLNSRKEEFRVHAL
jgi:hypothetical protein